MRFTTSHPKDLSAETIAAMAETPPVCRYLHLPVQSGSDRILAAMRRALHAESYLALVARLCEAMPDLALSTDIIVGFPGETEADFEETMRVVEAAGSTRRSRSSTRRAPGLPRPTCPAVCPAM